MNTEQIALSDIFSEKGMPLIFEYDFDDGCQHDVWLKDVRDYEEGKQPNVKILKAQGACPPEDCGGVWGYQSLLHILEKKRKTADDKERLAWYCMDKNFNPDDPDIDFLEHCVEITWETVLEKIASKNTTKK